MKNNNICNGKFINNIDIQELENSMLVIAKKKSKGQIRCSPIKLSAV